MSRVHADRFSSSIVAILILGSLSVPAIGEAAAASRVSVEPRHVVLNGFAQTCQLVVSEILPDHSARDLTAVVRYRSLDPKVAVVDRNGRVEAVGEGQASIEIEASSGTEQVEVSVSKLVSSAGSSYRHEVAAVLSRAGCNSGPCHGNVNGKGGFRLSLRGEDPAFDFASITRDTLGRRVERLSASRSLILLKPTGLVPHEGGVRFTTASAEYRTLLDWIRAGLTDDQAERPSVARLTVFPSERILAADQRSQQLRIVAEFADGSQRDVTRLASFDLSEPVRVSVTPEGRVVAREPLEVTVAVRYLNGRAVSRLAFLHDRPNFVWRGPEPANLIDRHVFAKLRSLKIRPAETSTDAVFVRRAYLDAIGVPPRADEVRAFLADTDPAKRAKLVDRLIQRPEFADFWALKWADLLRNEEKTMGDKGVWVFQRWLRDQIAADTPLDEFARQIVSAQGSTWSNPPASFYRTNRDPQSAAETIGQVFLGVRLQCARCHNHPFDRWTQNDYYGLAAYFANIDRKLCDPSRRDRFDNHEINGDVIIYCSGKPQMIQPRSGEMMTPRPLGGSTVSLPENADALGSLADWLTRDNPQFSRNMANRVWFHLMGRGVVEPVDDFRDSNPPSNPALLDALTAEFKASGHRLKPLVALIMKSATYGLGSESNETNVDDEANFAKANVKLLPAEVLLDSLGQVLEHPSRLRNAPRTLRVSQYPRVASTNPFLKTFGKPDRLLTCECERASDTNLAQAFQLINGESVIEMLESDRNVIGRLISSGKSDQAMLSELALAILGHEPTPTEASALLEHVRKAKAPRKGWEDVAWAMINSKEFLLRH